MARGRERLVCVFAAPREVLLVDEYARAFHEFPFGWNPAHVAADRLARAPEEAANPASGAEVALLAMLGCLERDPSAADGAEVHARWLLAGEALVR